MNARFFLLLILAALALAACRVSEVKTPDGFVALTDDQIEYYPYEWKAVSPDGAVVVVRERENEQEGSLDFWAESLKREITERNGYKLLDEGPVEGRNAKGHLMNFEVLYGGLPYRYTVALFVTEDDIITVETAASQEIFQQRGDALTAAIRSTTLK